MFRAIEKTLTRRVRRGMPLMLAVALGVTATTAMAQTRNTRPADDLRGGPGRDVPNRNLPPRDDSDRGGPGVSDSNSDDFPTHEMYVAVDANTRLAYARANFRRLQSSLDTAIRRMQYDFEHSREMLDATRAEEQAWHDYLHARNTALKSVVDDPKYKANVAVKEQLGDQIAEVRTAYFKDRPHYDRQSQVVVDADMMRQLVNMATVKLDYATVATDMEIAALRNDGKVADARERLRSSGSQVTALRDRFDHTVRDSQDLAGIRERIEDARIQLVAAQAFQNGANVVAAEALDYSYYKNRFVYNVQPYYPSDYGYGYGWRGGYRY